MGDAGATPQDEQRRADAAGRPCSGARAVLGGFTRVVAATAFGAALAASALLSAPTAALAAPAPAGTAASTVAAPEDPTPTPLESLAPESPDPTTDPDPDPDPTPTPEPDPEPTVAPEPTESPDPETAEPTESPATEEPTPTAEPTPTPTPTPSEAPAPTQVPAVPPAAADPATSVLSWVIAAAVLLVAAGILVVARRREPARSDSALILTGATSVGAVATTATPTADAPETAATQAAMEDIGEAMTDAGYSVATVRQALEDVARANGVDGTEIIVFPTALLVSARGEGVTSTGAVSSGERALLLHQVDELQRIVDDARAGSADPAEIRSRIARMRTMPPPYSRVQRGAAYVLLSAGLSVLLGASWTGVVYAALLGAGVGAVLLAGERLSGRYRALLTVGISFGVALVVLLGLRLGLDSGVLPALIAPLVVLLPGALLTVGSIELATGQMLSGAGRLAAGAMQLVLLAVGIVAAGALVGIPSLEVSTSATTLGIVAPWIAVAMFGVGIVVYQCAPWSSFGWILLVLYVAYGAQVLGAVFFGGVLSALIGALVATPVTVLVARRPSGPAALVSFMPAFWLLVPGALGLVGVASVLGGDASGSDSLVTTVSTIVGISLGVLAGTAISSRLGRPVL
ncbi:threonine/serine ThrE exporter family protein [Agromyces salentinus]|uniref:threonine/serine ThrE exporter family protein n=1 Tax=Agromyces salentinus TaxID=269421 RepID=UPI0012F8C0D5|nr:threonine/serine exporter family protein [Agromyces salentinus]